MRTLLLAALLIAQLVQGFVPSTRPFGVVVVESESKLFAHHPEKKIIKKKMHNRPKKHRLSDINRSNQNFGKCITKVANAPAEYTIISAEDYAKIRAEALKFWEVGSPSTPWIDITDEDRAIVLPQNIEPLPVGGVQKRPNIVRSGSC